MKPLKPRYILTWLLVVWLSVGLFAQSTDESNLLGGDKGKTVQVFPNPAVEYVNIRFETAKVDDVKLTLHNLIGNEIKVDTEKVDEHEVRLKVKDLASGYYLVAVREKDSNLRATYKFLKR